MKCPYVFTEHKRDRSKVNVWCTLAKKNHLIGLFFFSELIVTFDNYLSMLMLFSYNKSKVTMRSSNKMVLLLINPVRDILDEIFSQCCIIWDGQKPWPTLSFRINIYGFLILGFCEAKVIPRTNSLHSVLKAGNKRSSRVHHY